MNEFLSYITRDNIIVFVLICVVIWLLGKIIGLINLFILKPIKLFVNKYGFKKTISVVLLALIILFLLGLFWFEVFLNTIICLIFLGFIIELGKEKLNYPQEDRYKQSIMPIVSILYGLLVMGISIWFSRKFVESQFLATQGYETYVPLFIQEKITSGSDWFSQNFSFLKVININKLFYYLYNVTIVWGFIVLKQLIKYIIDTFTLDFITTKLSIKLGCFEFSEYEKKHILSKKYEKSEDLLKPLFYWVALPMSLLLMIISQHSALGFFRANIFPVFGLLALGELFYFLMGDKRKPLPEVDQEIDTFVDLSEISECETVYNYRAIFEILKEQINSPEHVLHEYSTSSYLIPLFKILENYENGTDKRKKAIGKFFTKLKENGENINTTYITKTISMIENKHSILFNTPFYKDLDDYILIPMILHLMSYKKVLFIAGRENIDDDVKNWIENEIISFCGTNELWNIDSFLSITDKTDIAILNFTDIYETSLLNNNTDFLSQVGFVFLIEPSRMLTTGQIGLSFLVSHLSNDVVYCACNRYCKGLRNTLTDLLRISYLDQVNFDPNTLQSYCFIMNWATSNDLSLHNNIPCLENFPTRISLDALLPLIAIRNGVPNSLWVGSDNFPIKDIKEKLEGIISDYMNTSIDQVEEKIETHSNLWEIEVKDTIFITIDDEINNLFEIANLFRSRSKNISFINTLSKNYLLRNYLADNPHVFIKYPTEAIPYISPKNCYSEKNILIDILLKMINMEVSEKTIKEVFDKRGIDYEGIDCDSAKDIPNEIVNKKVYLKLIDLIKTYIKIDETDIFDISNKPEVIYTKNTYLVVNTTYLRIESGTKLNSFIRSFKFAVFCKEDNEKKSGAILRNQIFQKYIKGENITHQGHYYRIQNIENGNIHLIAEGEYTDNMRYLRQIRNYKFTEFSFDGTKSSETKNGFELIWGIGDIFVETKEFFKLKSFNDLMNVTPTPIPNQDIHLYQRNYYRKNVLCLKFKYDLDVTALFTLSVVLSELFITTFPENYHYLAVMINKEHESNCDASKLIHSLQIEDNDASKDNGMIYILEDSEMGLGLLEAIAINLEKMFEIIADYFDWNNEKSESFKNLESVINPIDAVHNEANNHSNEDADNEGDTIFFETEDDVESQNTDDKDSEKGNNDNNNGGQHITIFNNYLNFGYNELPNSFNVKDIQGFLKEFTYDLGALKKARLSLKNEKDYGLDYFDDDNEEIYYCDFCAEKRIITEHVLDDKRSCCDDCKRQAVETKEHLIKLFKKALQDMSFFFGIKGLEGVNIKVFMTNAHKIAEKNNSVIEFTRKYDERPTSYLEQVEDGYYLWVENNAPSLTTLINIVSELTNIWHIKNMDEQQDSINKESVIPNIKKGMSEWVKIQYLLYLNEVGYAKRMIIHTLARQDAVGMGFAECFWQFGLRDVHNVGISEFFNQFDDDIKQTQGSGKETPFNSTKIKEKKKRWTRKDWKNRFRRKNDDGNPIVCDFCGVTIKPEDEYDKLDDGLDRCLECGETAIFHKKEFESLYEDIKEKMSKYFRIEFNKPIKVFVENVEKIEKALGRKLVVTSGWDPRAGGYAWSPSTGHEIHVEYGAPWISMLDTTAHELTHIWQHDNDNWKYEVIEHVYGVNERKMIIEGMAVWASIQYLLTRMGDDEGKIKGLFNKLRKAKNTTNESQKSIIEGFIKRYVEARLKSNSEYGRGLAEYYRQYGFEDKYNIGINDFIKNLGITTLNKGGSPFKNSGMPLEQPIYWTDEKWTERINNLK